MSHLLLDIGLVGLLTSSIFCGLVLIAVLRYGRGSRSKQQASGDFVPPVSLLKPLHGDEPGLEDRLEGFFRQDYPDYEILFCARSLDDPGLQTARRVAEKFPHIRASFQISGEPRYWNAKVASLERMAEAARHGIFVISDSDVQVTPSYLREVVAPFANPGVGMVTCLYRGLAQEQGIWSGLEAAGMSIEMTSGVLVANLLEGMKFALGPTMAVRSDCVDSMGGFGVLGRYCADDFVLGSKVSSHGQQVVLSSHVIDHVVLNAGFLESAKHQVRWMKSTRFSRPKGHLGTGLTFGVPFGLLACVASIALHRPAFGICLLIWSIATRIMLALVIGRRVLRVQKLADLAILYPLRDLMGFVYWLFSYAGATILWRGEIFEMLPGGMMRPTADTAAAESAAAAEIPAVFRS